MAASALGCGAPDSAANGASASPSASSNVWSPPGAVAVELISPGPPLPVRAYAGHPWTDWRETRGHSAHRGNDKVVCKDCHTSGFQPGGGDVACGREGCHVAEAAHPHGATGALAGEGGKGCARCHGFAPGAAAPTCLECHATPQTKAGGELAAITDGHAKADCGKCHHSHQEPLSAAADCVSCHEQRAPVHGGHAGSGGCRDCHASHQPAAAARQACARCHSAPAGPRPAHHAACQSCHEPHAKTAPSTGVCVGCHKARVTLRADRVPQHAVCTSCHTPHAPDQVGDASCTKCHVKAKVEHPARSGKSKMHPTPGAPVPPRACAACHVPHPDDPTQKVAHCTSCHASVAPADEGVHATSLVCTSCHKPHDFKAPTSATLRGFCGRCHEAEAKRTTSRKGHEVCSTCHASAHQKSPPTACVTCHETQVAGTIDSHRECATCHDPHSGAVKSNDGCAKCHTDRAEGPHRAIPKGCPTCHGVHGAAATKPLPACTACHKAPARKGLHQGAGHRDCATCHSAHEMPRADRASCTRDGCHVDRRKHEPNAERCAACHAFAW